MICNLCPRVCGALRKPLFGAGVCGMGTIPVVARTMLHRWEEPCISGTRGSGAVFFSGCALHCVFCQNEKISHLKKGAPAGEEELARMLDDLAGQGAHNINLVNPAHFAPFILGALKKRKNKIPVVYNSGGYEKADTLRIFSGEVNVYLPDIKFYHAAVSARYAGAPDYFPAAVGAVREMFRQTGPVRFDDDGLIQSGVIIRHLVLPGQVEQTKRILAHIADHMPKGIYISVMAQYTPCAGAESYPEINRRVTPEEWQRVLDWIDMLGLTDGYIQQLDSAQEKYIPDF